MPADLALAEDHTPLRVETRGEVYGCHLPYLPPEHLRVLRHGNRVQVHDAEVVLVFVLHRHPVLERPHIVAHMQVAARLYPAEYSLFALHERYSNGLGGSWAGASSVPAQLPSTGDLAQPDLSQGSVAQLPQLVGYDPVSGIVRMNSVETQITLGFRILIAVRPVEGQIHLGVGYALCVRGGGDVRVDLAEIDLENLEVVHVTHPAVVRPGVGDYVGPDVGVVDIHCSHDGGSGRTQLENLRRDGVPVGLEFRHGSLEAVLVVGPTAGPILVRLAGCPEVVPADIPGDDLRLAGGAPERRIVAEGREQLGTGPSVLAEVCACDRYPSVGLNVRFVAGHVALERTVACGQRVAECHMVPRGWRGESGSLRRTHEEDHDKDEPQQAPYGAFHVCSPGEARDSALLRHNPLLCPLYCSGTLHYRGDSVHPQMNHLPGELCDIWFPLRLPKRPLRGVTLPDFSSSLAPVAGQSA